MAEALASVTVGGVQDQLEHGTRAAGNKLLLVFLNANASVSCDGGGVDPIDRVAVGIRMREDTGDRGIADQLGLTLRDAAGVGDLDVFEIARRCVREEVAETLRHLNVGVRPSAYSSCESEGRFTAFCTTPSFR